MVRRRRWLLGATLTLLLIGGVWRVLPQTDGRFCGAWTLYNNDETTADGTLELSWTGRASLTEPADGSAVLTRWSFRDGQLQFGGPSEGLAYQALTALEGALSCWTGKDYWLADGETMEAVSITPDEIVLAYDTIVYPEKNVVRMKLRLVRTGASRPAM